MVAAARLTACNLCRARDALTAKYDEAYRGFELQRSEYYRGLCHGYAQAVDEIDKHDCQLPLHVERDELDRAENKRNSLPVWLQWAIGALGVAVWWVAK